MTQQGDVLLYQTTDEGEVNVVNGVMEMSGGLQTAAYVSLFGGNEDDAGGSDTTQAWWGNVDETLPERQYRSETQHLLQALAAVSANLRRIEDAAGRDLAWMVDQNVANTVEVAASMPGLNKVTLSVTIDGDSTVEYTENWNAKS